MSYDYLLFSPKTPITTPDDIDAHSVQTVGDGPTIRAKLSALYPEIDWDEDTGWLEIPGETEEDTIGYDLLVPAATRETVSVAIRASHDGADPGVIARICRELGWVAFDGQQQIVIRG